MRHHFPESRLMQTYAYGFLFAGLASACFLGGVTPEIGKLGKVATGVFATLFVVTEAMALFGA